MDMNEFLKDALSGRADVNAQRKLQANARDEFGQTALRGAAGQGRAEVARKLVDAGADVTLKDNNCRTALMWAEQDGRAEIVGILNKEEGAR